MRRAVFVFALVFVLALGVVFSARNVGFAQGLGCQGVNGSLKSLPQPPYNNPKTGNPLPSKPGMRPPKEIRDLPVCAIKGTNTADQLTGTNNAQLVDQIVGKGGNDTLRGRGGWNGLIGGTGEDTIKGGPGRDIVFAIDRVQQTSTGENAQVEVNQNISPQVDTIVSCGAGNDTVYVDEIDEVAADCEQVELAEPDIPVAHWYRRLVGR
jgi:Ca2+-binding RTX toxin-like protein